MTNAPADVAASWALELSLDWRGASVLCVGHGAADVARLVADRLGATRSATVDFDELLQLERSRVAGEFDAVCCVGTFAFLRPTVLRAVLEWCFDRLRPGGECLLHTKTYFAWDLLHTEPLTVPFVHLLFAGTTIQEFVASRRGQAPPYVSPLSGASYLLLYRSVGFELCDARRVENAVDEGLYEHYGDKLRFYDPLELRTAEVVALLRRPSSELDVGVFGSG